MLVDLSTILALTYRRVILGQLAYLTTPDQVKPRVADMSDGDNALLDDSNGEDASHPVPVRIGLCEAINLVIRECDGFPNAVRNRACLALQAGPQ
jgi:hypothetical protein